MGAKERKQSERMRRPWSYAFLSSLLGVIRDRKHFNEVKNFVLFLGYPRSGHSLVGSIIDAHPNAVVANELDALNLIEYNYSKLQLYYLSRDNTIKLGNVGRNNSGYDYSISNEWQGRHKAIHVIGDKKGGRSSQRLAALQSFALLEKTKEVTQRPLKIIHVVRNPFDNITTMVNRNTVSGNDEELPMVFKSRVDVYFRNAAINQKVILSPEYEVHTMYSEDINQLTLKALFDFLQLPTTLSFLDNCVEIVWPNPNKSSQKVDFWTPERIALVSERMAAFPFLDRYQFDGRISAK